MAIAIHENRYQTFPMQDTEVQPLEPVTSEHTIEEILQSPEEDLRADLIVLAQQASLTNNYELSSLLNSPTPSEVRPAIDRLVSPNAWRGVLNPEERYGEHGGPDLAAKILLSDPDVLKNVIEQVAKTPRTQAKKVGEEVIRVIPASEIASKRDDRAELPSLRTRVARKIASFSIR